jgi:adenine specific DNA methylase Mod
MKLENVIYSGDNLTWLKQFPDKLVDLIYLDPPFFSNKHYEVIFNDGEEIRSFEDRWKGGINHYIEWMKERIFELHRVLKDAGSFYLHCDWHASHYLKVTCDNIFGYNNFRNEIIWHYRRWTNVQKQFQKMHDVILFYAKTDDNIFNPIEVEISDSQKNKFQRGYDTNVIHTKDKITRQIIIYDIEKVKKARINISEYDNVVNREAPKVFSPDVWIMPPINSQAKERMGYPTQKPEKLIERIILASSNKNDLILDPFCGCGTTIAVAQRLGRKWIGIDVSPSACKLMKLRVEKVMGSNKDVEIIGLPLNIDELKKLPPFEFQNWCIGALGGTVNPKKVGDMGIDGFTFMHRDPIQVKQSENVGRNVIDNFETALQRDKKDKGFIIALSFGKGAYEEVARIKKEGLFIDLLTVDKLLGFSEEKVSDKMFEFY